MTGCFAFLTFRVNVNVCLWVFMDCATHYAFLPHLERVIPLFHAATPGPTTVPAVASFQ